MANDGDDTQFLGIRIATNNTARGVFRSGAGNHVVGSTTVADAEWIQIVLVVASLTDRRLYLNGVLDGSATDSDAFPSSLDNTTIGALLRATAAYYAGLVRQVVVFNYALSAEEVFWLYHRPYD